MRGGIHDFSTSASVGYAVSDESGNRISRQLLALTEGNKISFFIFKKLLLI
jgi:hypothetical protein